MAVEADPACKHGLWKNERNAKEYILQRRRRKTVKTTISRLLITMQTNKTKVHIRLKLTCSRSSK